MNSLDQILQKHQTISLRQLNELKFSDRTDTKFVFSIDMLSSLMDMSADHYRILNINGKLDFQYETIYYDTKELDFYYDHHQGKRSRFKVRVRKYTDTNDCFLEVKEKNNKERTIKRRIWIPSRDDVFTESSKRFIRENAGLDPGILQPALRTNFRRITLSGTDLPERITIDRDISCTRDSKNIHLSGIVIAEIKREHTTGSAKFCNFLKILGIRPVNVSKYAIGMALLNPDVKHNRFKEKIIQINRISHDNCHTRTDSRTH